MRLAMMIIGTLLAVFLIIKYIKGKKYADLIEGLDDDKEYPLKGLYIIGFSMNDNFIFKLHDKNKDELISQAKLLYDARYAEYYALVSWAQTLTFVYLGVCFGFIIGGMFNSLFFVFVGAIFAAICGYYFYTRMKKKVDERKEDCVSELPEVVSTIAMLMNSGMTLKEVWELVANSKEGTVYSLMKQSCIDMKNGMTEKDAIAKFGIYSNSAEVKKFTSVLIQGIDKGSRDLSEILAEQSIQLLEAKKQYMLQKGEAASSKLLIPTTLIFVGVMIVVIAAAVGLLLG